MRSLLFRVVTVAVGCAFAARPYEFVRANRTVDDVPPLVDFEEGKAWTATATDAGASSEISQEEQLFGQNTLKLTYCGKGPSPRVTLAPPQPVALPRAFDTLYVWVKGNHFGVGGNTELGVPNPALSAVFRTAQGGDMKISLSKIVWPDWHQVNRRFTEAERAKLAGASFAGFELSGGTQTQYLQMHFDNVAVFADDLKTPEGIEIVGDEYPDPPEDPPQLFFHGVCATTRKPYLMRLKYVPYGGGVYFPDASFPVPDDFFIDGG